jgi:hypothetical protein
MFTQIISPNLDTVDGAGWCLRFVSKAFGINTNGYPSSTAAAEASQIRSDNLPDVAVLVWFDHYGSYGTPPKYDNWGHVMIYVPGKGFFGSPGNGVGNIWLNSIQEIEQYFNATYKGWSLDLAGTPVAAENNKPITGRKDKDMYTVINSKTKKTYTIGNQFIKHEQDATRAAIVASITMGSQYNVPQLDQFGFDVLCDSMGVPRAKAAALNGGASWSREMDIQNAQ